MKAALLDVLRCPVCGGRLRLDGGEDSGDATIAAGRLGCAGCGGSFPIADEMPRMLDDRLPGIREKRAEIAGWVAMASADEWYVPNDEVDLTLPYVGRDLGWDDPTWLANEYSFSILLGEYARPGMRVLEVGAAKCWGARHLVPKGCRYVATDILDDANIGIGRGAFYASRFGHFERVQADGEHLPFAAEAFDLTYCVATLHHALDLGAMVGEMARVTRPGGWVIALNEGTRPLGWSPEAPGQEKEKGYGINEHVHALPAYLWSFLRAGLVPLRLERADGKYGEFVHFRSTRRLERLPKGRALALLWMLGRLGYSGVSIFARKVRRPG